MMAIAHDSYQKVANKVRQKACWRRKLMALRAKIPIFLQQLILSAKHAPLSVAMFFSNNYKQLQTILIYPLASGALCAMLRMEINELRSKN